MGFVLRSKGKFHSLIKEWRGLSLSSGGLALPTSHGQGCCIGISSWGERGIHEGLQGRAAHSPGHTARSQPPGLEVYTKGLLSRGTVAGTSHQKLWSEGTGFETLYTWHPMTSETHLNTKEKHTKRLDFIISIILFIFWELLMGCASDTFIQPVIQKLSSVLTCSSHLGCRYYQQVASKVYYEFHLSILKEYRMWKR